MSMLEILETLKLLMKVRNVAEKPVIDNKVFQLHYRTTCLILFMCCAFVTAYSIFGKAVECIGSDNEEDKDRRKVINTYCYLGYTFTLPKNENSNEKLAGIGQGEGEKYLSYYRWVPLMLFLQGVSFYLPHWIWKNYENKRFTYLTDGLRGPIMNIKKYQKYKLKSLAKYAADSFHTHNQFALMYYFCEILNFLIVILNMYVIDAFLEGEFMKYGIEVMNFIQTRQGNRTDPMIKVFPRITKCNFVKYGPSGTVQTLDYVCILALNNLNEKIYIFLWFWFIILAFLSILPVIYNLAAFLSPRIRERKLNTHCTFNDKSKIENLAEKVKIGDFFLLDLLGRNMSSRCYREFINQLYDSLNASEKPSESEEENIEQNSGLMIRSMCLIVNTFF